MSKRIVIFGTKGVGKTTLFNRLTKKYALEKEKKISPIVNYAERQIKIENQVYQLIDTPAFNLSPKSVIEKGIGQQINEVLVKSDLICWVVNQIDETTLWLNRILRKYPAPRILVFNQIDLEAGEEDFSSERFFGLDYRFSIASLTESDLEQLAKKMVELLPSSEEPKEARSQRVNLLIFGPPNSGKSTLMNYLLQKNRSLVTPLAGTTQEPVISQWSWEKINFQLVDTAGITKEETISRGWWRKCELVWAVIDATVPLTKQILQIVNLGEKFSKPLVIVINKVDLLPNHQTQAQIEVELRKRLKSLGYVPVVFLSAFKGTKVPFLLKISEKMFQKINQKFSKQELDTQIQKMVAANSPPSFSGHQLKIYFVKHEAGPAHYFIFFVNNPRWVHFAYQRYLVNRLRESLGLEYLPIRIVFRKSV